jgi:HAD superfamily hydrolase (TIGR01549 family)
MKKKLIIFDLDGTLVDAYPAINASFNAVMGRLGYPRQSALTIRRAVGWGDRQLLEPFIRPGDLDEAQKIYRRHHAQALRKKVRWLPGAKPLLAFLKKRGYRLAIASNRPTRFTGIILKTLGGRRFFDVVLCADKLPTRKPHPLIVRMILRRCRTAPRQALFVGDMAIDVQTAQRAGIDSAAVATGSSSRSELKRLKPTYLLKEISEVKKILASL